MTNMYQNKVRRNITFKCNAFLTTILCSIFKHQGVGPISNLPISIPCHLTLPLDFTQLD